MKIQYPMFFRISVPETERETYCGVLEFVARENTCIIPGWVFSYYLFR